MKYLGNDTDSRAIARLQDIVPTFFGDSPPTNTNLLWIDTTNFSLNFYYNDGTSSQWVELNNSRITTSGVGISMYYGSSVPDTGAGYDGDVYFYLSDPWIYLYKKISGGWVFSGIKWVSENAYTALSDRISIISNFASPNAGGIFTGNYYDNSFQGTAASNLAGVANRLDMAPYYTSVTFSIDRIGVTVNTAVAGATGRVVIYSNSSSGWPDQLLYYGSSDLSFAATGYVSHTLSFTFNRGTQYWLGIHQSSTAKLITINLSSAVNLGLSSSTATSYYNVVRRSVTYASGAPTTFAMTSADLAAATPPSIRFRAA